jgi:hypothetical protein
MSFMFYGFPVSLSDITVQVEALYEESQEIKLSTSSERIVHISMLKITDNFCKSHLNHFVAKILKIVIKFTN